jgi:hypothetical protein
MLCVGTEPTILTFSVSDELHASDTAANEIAFLSLTCPDCLGSSVMSLCECCVHLRIRGSVFVFEFVVHISQPRRGIERVVTFYIPAL